MKKLLIVTLAIILTSSLNAQILRNIARSAGNQAKNSAENKASEEVNKQVDKSVNKFFDNLVKEDTTKKSKPQPTNAPQGGQANGGGNDQPPAGLSNFMKSLGVSTEVPPHKDAFKFTGQITSVIEGTDGSGEKTAPIESTICFDEGTTDAMFRSKVQGNSSAIVMDQANSCMIMLNESEKTGLISKLDLSGQAGSTQTGTAAQEDDCKMTKTGKTKSVSGYNCSEYRCENADGISIAWTTNDFGSKINKILGSSSTGTAYKTEGVEGMVIQYEFHSKSDKSSSIMTIKSIDMKKSSSISLAGYQFTALNIGMKK
jgi:hypothetical protein